MAEDSFILLDALEQDQHEVQRAALCVEIGSGSGVVSTFIAMMTSGLVLCTDINAHAARATVSTARQNKVDIEPVLANLLDPIRTPQIDILCFNPPYVETYNDE
jgi:release factor glutamine methyltransferase